MSRTVRMNQVVKVIRANGFARLNLNGTVVKVGFENGGHEGVLVMLGGGYYVVRTATGKHNIGKGQDVTLIEG